MSHNSRGTKKNQIALIKCVRGGQGTKKTRKKLPGNGIFSDLHPSQANIYTHIYIYIWIYIYIIYIYIIYIYAIYNITNHLEKFYF